MSVVVGGSAWDPERRLGMYNPFRMGGRRQKEDRKGHETIAVYNPTDCIFTLVRLKKYRI
eukprot:COSAG01_NODE_2553_length_7463_cov_57.268468_7_plen_60_part_00